jgi:uncharacterized membrane protein YedE/YeeE
LYLVGALLGLTLYHAAFGFTSAYRLFICDGRGAGLRAQMLMLAFGTLLFFPALTHGSLLGRAVAGHLAPLGTSLLVGAFMFGVGMQLGGACASGTLYTIGGGSTRMLVTLCAFVAGSVIATAHMPFWSALPSLPAVSLIQRLGMGSALALNWVLCGAIAWITVVIERRRHGWLDSLLGTDKEPDRVPSNPLKGPWPLAAGALALAALNFATLALSGRPWGVTSAFALWGAKLLALSGVDVAHWPYWMSAANAASLQAPLSRDITSVMNIGIIVGALTASALAGRYAPVWRIAPRSLLAGIIGGGLLGYGARLASGCNIGAYFSAIVSGSLHGWLWMAAALAGNVLGVYLRPLFGLEVERR